MNIGVLTSSRADYGIYLPLLKALSEDSYFDLEIIAFGTHLSKFHGYTLNEIEKDGFKVNHTITSLLVNDNPESISTAYGLTLLKFAQFWNLNHAKFDIVFCLGDRFEMAAAVYAGLPYNIKYAHLHGGETTIGAIDNIYRHSITLASSLHFVSTDIFYKRVLEITGENSDCNVVGSLSLLNLKNIKLLSIKEFNEKWNIDLSIPSILLTIHPETVNYEENKKYVKVINSFIREVLNMNYQVVITLPNADTFGNIYRDDFVNLKNECKEKLFLIENFGTQSYFTCMKYAKLLVGNSSSGIIEAASFGKYVLNIGDRQKGRYHVDNVVDMPFNYDLIIENFKKYIDKQYEKPNPYFNENAVSLIISKLKNY